MNEILDNKKAVTDCTWADTCVNAQTTPLIRRNFKNEFEYCVPNADKNNKVFNIKDRQNDLSVLYDKYPEAKKLIVYYPQLTAIFKEQLDEAQEERFRRLIGRKIKIVDLEQEPENSSYFGKVGEIQDIQVDPFGDVVLYGTWGGIGIYPKYDSFVYVNDEPLQEDELEENVNLNEAYEDWKLEVWINGNPRNMSRMSSDTMSEYAIHTHNKACEAIRQQDWNRANRCISILCDLRNNADIKGYRNCNWFPGLVHSIETLQHNLDTAQGAIQDIEAANDEQQDTQPEVQPTNDVNQNNAEPQPEINQQEQPKTRSIFDRIRSYRK